MPKTSKYLCNLDGPGTNFSIRVFDLAKPEAGASVAGLGLGNTVLSLKTHEVRLPARSQGR